MRKALVISWLVLLFGVISYTFWYNEWKYTLPTPVPQNYVAVPAGTPLNLASVVPVNENRPAFIHFFNPDCPCSRFNIPHFNSLVKKYGDRIDFSVVVVNKKKEYSAEEIQSKFDLTVPVSFDTAIAGKCGVYSTPQAVLLDKDHNLYYRGNYNKARYCTDKNSMFAQIAIDSLLQNQTKPSFSPLAVKAYGCSLPSCTK
jgi:thiol-disulfide isomerase/thioredoxin